jgi:hypothetical protein
MNYNRTLSSVSLTEPLVKLLNIHNKNIGQCQIYNTEIKVDRIDVIRQVCDYVKFQNLNRRDDTRIIVPDDNLKLIINKAATTYPELQKAILNNCI